MSAKRNAILTLGLSLLVMACQTEPRLTSTNPLLQSESSRALREAFNGLSVQFLAADQPGFQGCRNVATFARSGDLIRESKCSRINGDDPVWRKDGAGGGVQISKGSWTVRDEELCFNLFSIEGVETSAADKIAQCWPASISGNKGLLGGEAFTVVGRGS